MAATEELFSQDSSPMGRSHMKGVVHRNAVEDVAYGRLARHIDSQRKAFVRQNTRDEDEMKSFLSRLQCEQQLPAFEDDGDDDDVLDDTDTICSESQEDVLLKQDQSANPYPITILPKFPGNQRNSGCKASSPESTRSRLRRISGECDELQESLSAMTLSSSPSTIGSINISQSGSTGLSSHDDGRADWLATPDAISSVRRARRTVSEQSFRKNLIRTNSESLSQHDNAFTLSSKGNIRSNSMKDKRRPTLIAEVNAINRRGGSLKERRHGTDNNGEQRKKVARSYSMLTRAALTEFNQKQEMANLLQGKVESTTEKQSLSRKSSNNTDDSNMKLNGNKSK